MVKPTVAARAIYEFGGFRLDPARRRLETSDGKSVPLNAKAFDALAYLVEHAGEPVSRMALMEALWPSTVVEENSLTQAISALRRAIGASHIVTLAGRGYQFVEEVRVTGADAGTSPDMDAPQAEAAGHPVEAHPAPPVTLPAAGGSRSSRRVWLAGGAVATLAIALGAWSVFAPQPVEDQTHPAAVVATPLKVLVLPFASPSPELEERSLADGLTDELITRLGQLPGVRVQGRTTSFALRDSGRGTPEIASDLGVQYVIEGSVGRDADQLRVRAQLTDRTGFSVWADSYDRPLASIFEIQDDIVAAIAEELSATLGLEQALRRPGTDSVEAYQLYLLARAEAMRGFGATGGYARPMVLLDRALQIDEGFAAAWSLMANLKGIVNPLLTEGREAELAAAEAAASRAVELAPDLGNGYSARAMMRSIRGDWLGAEQDFLRARELGVDTGSYPNLLMSMGRFEHAREISERYFETDPLSADCLAFLLETYELLGDREAADAVYERGSALYDFWFGHDVMLWIRLGRGDVASILERPSGGGPYFARFMERLRDADRGLALVRELATSEQPPAPLLGLSIWAAYFGDAELSLRLLERAVTGSAALMAHAWLPLFDDVRRLPAFEALLVDIGLVDYWRENGWPEACRPSDGGDFVCS